MHMFIGKAESRQRAIEESRSLDSHAKHAARGVRRHGRFAGTGLERCKRRAPEEELPVAPERRIPPVWAQSVRDSKTLTT